MRMASQRRRPARAIMRWGRAHPYTYSKPFCRSMATTKTAGMETGSGPDPHMVGDSPQFLTKIIKITKHRRRNKFTGECGSDFSRYVGKSQTYVHLQNPKNEACRLAAAPLCRNGSFAKYRIRCCLHLWRLPYRSICRGRPSLFLTRIN